MTLHNYIRTYKKTIVASIIAILAIYSWFAIPQQAKEYIYSRLPFASVQAPQKINGSIISLKKISADDTFDFHAMFSRIVRDAFEVPKNTSIQYTAALINRIVNNDLAKKTMYYGIIDNATNKLIGGIEIREFNKYDNGQLGCWLNEQFWGGGRIQEALLLISQAYFKQYPHLENYIAHVRAHNPRSLQALRKFGFVDHGYNAASNRHILTFYKTALATKH